MNETMQPEIPRNRALLTSPPVHFMILVLLAVIIYSNTFQVPMLFDDEASITANPLIQDLGNYFSNSEGYNDRPNRYIGYLSFALNYRFGGLNVAGYHAVNLAIHILNTLLVYGLARLTLRTPLFGKDRQVVSAGGAASFIPFFAALLFAVHPVQTQAVTYIVQRLTSLATLFYLASLVLHVRWRLACRAGARFLSPAVLPWWLISLFSAVLAMKSKEIAFTLPFIVLLYEAAFFGELSRKLVISLAPLLATVAIIPLTMVNVLKPTAELLADAKTVTVAQSALSRWEYLFTQFSVILTYLRLLVLPVNQNLDYDYPVNHSLLEPRAFLSLLVLLALVAAGMLLWYRSLRSVDGRRGDQNALLLRIGAFGIFWFFITLSVESSVIPITDVIFEHRLYLPSIGLFIAAVSLIFAAASRPARVTQAVLDQVVNDKAVSPEDAGGPSVPPLSKGGQGGFVVPVTVPLLVLALLLSASTYARNTVWQSGETLWRDVMAKSPAKARPYVNLGAIYGEQERVADSLREFETAIKLDPQHPEALSNLVLLYVSSGRLKEAENTCGTLIKLDPKLEFRVNLYRILAMPDDGNPALRTVRDVCHVSTPPPAKVGAL